MEIKHKNYYNDDASFEVEIPDLIARLLKNLDFFLQSIEKDYPASLGIIINSLAKKFNIAEKTIIELENQYSMLKDHPDLFKRAISSILSFLNYSKYKNQPKYEKSSVNVNDQLRALLHFSYIYATSLTEIMSREEAINYYQTFTDQNTRNNRDPSKYVDNLEIFMQDAKQFFETYQGHNSIEVIFNEGKRGIKNTKCKWHQVMKELNDPEFSYAVACHYDFEATKNVNPNFVLTRKRTLMQGADYCDFCYHDTQIIKEIEHPPDIFWNALK